AAVVVVRAHGDAHAAPGRHAARRADDHERALAAPGRDAPEPRDPLPAVQAPAGPERAAGIGGGGRAHPVADLVDPARAPARSIAADLEDVERRALAARAEGRAAGAIEGGEHGERRAGLNAAGVHARSARGDGPWAEPGAV